MKTLMWLAPVLLLTACSNMGVKPWERDVLAKAEMQLDSRPVDAALDDHIYFSKEAVSGVGRRPGTARRTRGGR